MQFSSLPLYRFLVRHYSTHTNLGHIRCRYRAITLRRAQQVLTDYLHATRCLPFTHAEHISNNSPFSLSNLLSKIKFTSKSVSYNVQKYLRYHPINEYEFFFESIGLSSSEIADLLPSHKFFLSDDRTLLPSVGTLVGLGFPWNWLGRLYKEEVSIFGREGRELSDRILGFVGLGFDRSSVVGICLAFPFVLRGDCELDSEIDAMFADLKRVFIDFGLMASVDGNVDVCYEFCTKINVFYDLGCERGTVGELIGRNHEVFLGITEEILRKKVNFFVRLGARKVDAGLLILRCPEILNFDLESPVISVFDFLRHCGLDEAELSLITSRCPYVLGKNKLAHLPQLMRALDLNEWLVNRIVNGNHHLLANFDLGSCDEDTEKVVSEYLETIRSLRKYDDMIIKFNFLLGLGFGENKRIIQILPYIHGNRSQLQSRFDCLLSLGIKYSKLCKMINMCPKILNQNPDALQQKVNFLCNDLHYSLQHLDDFPAYLCFNLENRIKLRYKFLAWLREYGLLNVHYSLSTVVAVSEKKFILILLGIHRAVPKQWLEYLSSTNHRDESNVHY